MILSNFLYKVCDTETGEVNYCMNLSQVCMIVGASGGQRYAIMKNKKYKNYTVEEIDGELIPWGKIYKK